MMSVPTDSANDFAKNFTYSLPPDFKDAHALQIEGCRIGCGSAVAALEPGPQGYYGLSHTENGRTVRLTSAVNPAAEDRTLVDKFPLDPTRGVLCLGLGLGYCLEELNARLAPEAPLWVMESRPELAAVALMSRDFSKIMARPGFRLFIGPFNNGLPWGEENAPDQILARPGTVRHFHSEYPALSYQRAAFTRHEKAIKKVLVFQSDYYLDREIAGSLKMLGQETAVWHFQRGLTGLGDNYRELLGLIKGFRPDMVLTVNHLGFDGEGMMDDLFSRLKLPVASWFVDSPIFILGENRPSEYVSVFSWDSDYLEPLRAKGFESVNYLPLAADDRFFHPYHLARPERDIAFVGDTLTAATFKYLDKLGLSESILDKIDAAAAGFLAGPGLLPADEMIASLMKETGLKAGSDSRPNLEALITWRASRLWRLKILSALPKESLTLAGDDNWPALMNIPAGQCLPPLDYYSELPGFYRTSRINLNITSAQMKSGLNQRIFDVPACGAFLLTDQREQLNALFEAGREVITYSSPEEARDLAAWYLNHGAAREEISNAAYERVKNQHLYHHRLAEMLRSMRRTMDR
ncbi:hypothetical protein C4J81_13055 [Deltaproteobacteria bacterium Smac51]|nr:hypothetical protein C4J81_13055 [Deltaproteobacteria bacterium Smac51]